MSAPTSTRTRSEADINRLLGRSALYQMIAFFFRYPDPGRDLSELKASAPMWREALKELSSDSAFRGAVQTSLEELLTAFETVDVRQWRSDHESILGHTARGRVPAHELEYGEAHSRREPQELADIMGYYGAFGLKMSDGLFERGDHVCVECEFMHYVLYKEFVASGDQAWAEATICGDASRSFLADHLARWLPPFTKRLSKASDGLLGKAAKFAHEFVGCDCRSLGIEVGPDGLPVRAVKENEDSGCVSCLTGRSGESGSETNRGCDGQV